LRGTSGLSFYVAAISSRLVGCSPVLAEAHAYRAPWREGARTRRRRCGCGVSERRHSSGRARHRTLGELDPGPDVHVDDDADDLEHLLPAEVLGERVVEALKRRVSVGVSRTSESLGVAERRLLGLGEKLGLPPRGQGVDLGQRSGLRGTSAHPGATRAPKSTCSPPGLVPGVCSSYSVIGGRETLFDEDVLHHQRDRRCRPGS
jgi:hypothetical protein